MSDDRLARTIAAFDAANAKDPNLVEDRPKQLVEAERIGRWIERLDPNASEALRLAAHCQHIERWKLPRSDFPPGRLGYLEWRKELARFHADRATEIMKETGYDSEVIDQVRRINLKRGLRTEPDTQTMEDALCLSFLEHDIEAFAAKHDDDKLVEILQKTWKKMSERGHAQALGLDLSPRVAELMKRALGG